MTRNPFSESISIIVHRHSMEILTICPKSQAKSNQNTRERMKPIFSQRKNVMTSHPNNKKNGKSSNDKLGAGIAIGVGVGLAIGTALGNPGA
jgi:hypothetical protein